MSEITVVIPNYNGMKYLAECMTSLCREQQNAPGYEVLIIDNASVDGSVEYLQKEWCGEGVRLISLPENTGFCHAVNLGIREAKTPYVILLNNDTKAEAGFVRGLYDAIRENEKIFSVSAKMLMWDRPELIDDAGDRYCVLGWAYSRGKGQPAADYDKSVPVFSACGGAAIYRRSVFEEIGYFDEEHFAYLEDTDIGYRARIYGYENWYAPKAVVYHVGSGTSGSRYNQFKTRYSSRNNVYLIYKNMPLFQIILNFPFLLAGFLIKFLFFAAKGMGKEYLAGIKNGFSISRKGHKVPFSMKHLPNYARIQLELWKNIFLRFTA